MSSMERGLAAALFVSVFITAVVSGVFIHYLWGGLGLIPSQGEAGGTAPSGYTPYLNVLFSLVFLGQVYVSHWLTQVDEDSGDPELHTG